MRTNSPKDANDPAKEIMNMTITASVHCKAARSTDEPHEPEGVKKERAVTAGRSRKSASAQ